MATKKTSKKSTKSKARKPAKKRQGSLIFSLDIGTRTVVGIVGKVVDGVFNIMECVSIPHTKRAMSDGQIEEIDEVAKIVGQVKSQLGEKLNVSLSHVCIAAAGRALRTQKIKLDIDVPNTEAISAELERTIEVEAVLKAQELIDSTPHEDNTQFYCVGHTVVSFALDGYKMKSVIGHKGKTVTIEVIAAFLPNIVVESLYAVTDKNKLTVSSLTLEPIAAMNVIIPPELRLINIALVDIGAGTSDIAISKDGSIVAYAMATIAGDEITEEIIKKYLVDFDTAEQMKFSANADIIEFKDILGVEHSIASADFYASIYPTVDCLADTIVKNIIEANSCAPSAVFLVGGGSQVPELCSIVAEKLGIPADRVAVGGHNFIKNVVLGGKDITGPEFVTPIGIGVTSTIQKGYDFSSVTLNDKKYRMFDTKNMSVLDLLMLSGYKARQIIGRSGKNLSFLLNGENILLKGEISTPAQLTVNDEPASVETKIKQGDVVKIIPATIGTTPKAKLNDFAEVNSFSVSLDGAEYSCGTTALVNGELVGNDYEIKNNDFIEVKTISTLFELLEFIGITPDGLKFQRGKAIISNDCTLKENDAFVSMKSATQQVLSTQNVTPIVEKIEQPVITPNTSQSLFTPEINIVLNGEDIILPEKDDNSPHMFLEVLNLINLDLSNPQGTLIMKINGNDASYTSRLNNRDNIEIYWS